MFCTLKTLHVASLNLPSFLLLQSIRGAGHYVYADQAEDFNQTILEVCEKVD